MSDDDEEKPHGLARKHDPDTAKGAAARADAAGREGIVVRTLRLYGPPKGPALCLAQIAKYNPDVSIDSLTPRPCRLVERGIIFCLGKAPRPNRYGKTQSQLVYTLEPPSPFVGPERTLPFGPGAPRRRNHMSSFEDILNKPASEIQPPQAYPVGTYHCIVAGPPAAGQSSQKKTDYLRFELKILSPMPDVDAAQAAEAQVVGKQVSTDFYITDGSAFRLKEFLVDHLEIPTEGINGKERSMKEMLADAPGRQVLCKLRHELSQDGKRVYHRVDSTAHV